MRILITGFGPFGKVVSNPSGRIVQQIEKEGLPGHELTARVLPVSFRRAEEELDHLLRTGHFDLALMLGVAGKRRTVKLERGAYNLDRARIPDCDGSQPQDTAIQVGAPELLRTKLPLAPLVAKLRDTGSPCSISYDAGRYVCNHTYYAALHGIAEAQLPTLCLFVHVPPDETTFEIPRAGRFMPFDRQLETVRALLSCLTDCPDR